MRNFLISLITAFTSILGFLSINNVAIATPVVNQELQPLVTHSFEQPVNLNVSASLWQLNKPNSQNIVAHLGCSCAVCSQSRETMTVNS